MDYISNCPLVGEILTVLEPKAKKPPYTATLISVTKCGFIVSPTGKYKETINFPDIYAGDVIVARQDGTPIKYNPYGPRVEIMQKRMVIEKTYKRRRTRKKSNS